MLCKYGDKIGGFTVNDLLAATGGRLAVGSGDAGFSGISIDSRSIEAGELFWAIKGDRHDGNEFIGDALKRGASGFVTDDSRCRNDHGDAVMISVDSSTDALKSMAAYNRRTHPVPLVGITGSNGKTTTKEILSSILAKKFEVLKNEGNLNNLIGVPLTLMKLHSDHEVAVIEMGMNRSGEIRELATMARPDIGVITNIGEAHLEGLGSLENIKKAKGELIEAMEDEKTVVLNADDDSVMDLAQHARGNLVTFGIERSADYVASDVEVEWGKGTLFILSHETESLPVMLPVYGVHQLYNALAASAVAGVLGLDLHEIREGLESYEAYSGRMEIISERGVNIINDSYNSNPPSSRHAIETLNRLADGRKIAVLGDMLELGSEEEDLHYRLGEFIFSKGIDLLVTVGRLAARIGEGALAEGMTAERVLSFNNRSDAVSYLQGELRDGDWVLVKGSRGMKMDEIYSKVVTYLKMEEAS